MKVVQFRQQQLWTTSHLTTKPSKQQQTSSTLQHTELQQQVLTDQAL
jgi:hypothetical protein